MRPSSIKYADYAAHIRKIRYERPFISHEWEELVERLSSSDDPKLREIGLLEREFLKLRKSPYRAV